MQVSILLSQEKNEVVSSDQLSIIIYYQLCLLQINELKVQYSSCYRSRYTESTLDSSYPVPDASREGGWKAADLKVSYLSVLDVKCDRQHAQRSSMMYTTCGLVKMQFGDQIARCVRSFILRKELAKRCARGRGQIGQKMISIVLTGNTLQTNF